ncbi:MAG: hypothetical protein U0670_12600 [Anaerolineae bacterium]
MSYIDTFDHEFVGFFGQLPVYHPLVVHQGGESRGEYSCNPRNLIIGGGSGEHPALILKHPQRAVTAFVIDWRSRPENAANTHSDDPLNIVLSGSEQWIEDLQKTVPASDALEFAGWEVEVFHRFFEMCTSPALRTPFAKHIHFEEWLLACFGEFIIFSMPELDERLPGAREVLYPLYTNILLPPPGYPIFGGRRLMEGKLVYNQRWWPNID